MVYENDAWIPVHAVVPARATGVRIDDRDPQSAAIRSEPDGVIGVSTGTAKANPIGPGTLLWSEAANRGWVASANGRHLVRRDAFGWTNAFALDSSLPVKVHYSGSGVLGLARAAEVVIWIALAAAWFVTRRRRSRPGPITPRRAQTPPDLEASVASPAHA